MLTLQETLKLIESALGVRGHAIYKKIGVHKNTYCTWRTGQRQNPRNPSQEKFQSEFGIDFIASRKKGELVITNHAQFLKRCKKRPLTAIGPDTVSSCGSGGLDAAWQTGTPPSHQAGRFFTLSKTRL